MKTMEQIRITNEELLELRKRLSDLDYKWMPLLLSKIITAGKKTKDKNLQNVTKSKIYNILYGAVKDNYWRYIVFKHGNELCTKLEREMVSLRKKINK